MDSPSPRPASADEFWKLEDELKRASKNMKNDVCPQCKDPYRQVLTALTEGYCPVCAAEVFYRDTKSASQGAMQRNLDAGIKRAESHDARTEGQQWGLGQTNGG